MVAGIVADIVVVVGENNSEDEPGPGATKDETVENKAVKKNMVERSIVDPRSMVAPKKRWRTTGDWIDMDPEGDSPPEVCERNAGSRQHTPPVGAWGIWGVRP